MNSLTSVTFESDVVFFARALASCWADGQSAKKEP